MTAEESLIEELKAENARLLAACQVFIQAANDAHEHWDADRDIQAGNLLLALSGDLTNYRQDLTDAHKTIAEAKGRVS